MRLRSDADDPTAPAERGRHIQVALPVKRQALRTAKAAIKRADFAALCDPINAVVAGGCRADYIEIAVRMKRQMIRGERWFDRRKNKNFPACADFEDRSAAVADVKIICAIERYSRGDAHALNPLLGAALRRNSVNCPVVAARNEEIPRTVERKPAGID